MNDPKRDLRRTPQAIVAAALCASIGACGGDAPTDSAMTGTEHAALVGGIWTTRRPEVGQTIAQGSECTATLISPTYVLTAGHCVNYSTSTTNVSFNPANTSTWYSASRVHTFGAYRPVTTQIPDGAGDLDDVAIMQLSSAVPSSIVPSPALVAPRPPNAGAQPYGTQMIFGYGCTNRNDPNSGGAKQLVTFTFGTQTQVLCSGDSGGPVFNSTGQIWAVASGYDTSTGIDSFGGASFYKEDMLGVIRQWEGDGTTEAGAERYGLDYSSIPNSSSGACQAACQADVNCRAATFKASNSTCYLKSAISDWVFNTDATSFTSPALREQVYASFNLTPYVTSSATSIDACLAACARDSRCAAYTISSSNSTCALMSSASAPVLNFTSVSGIKRGMEANTDRPNAAYSQIASASAAACATSCANDYSCRSFTWVGSVCYLHDAANAPVARTGATSGLKGGMEINTDRPGMDYNNFDVSFNLPQLCQASCASDSNCQAWTFVPAGRNSTNPHCWLKSGVPATNAGEGLVSGIRGAEFF
jgi:V8-like Glu-specific endopeptidase